MTKDEIIEMARKSDFEIHPDNLISFDGIDCTSELIAFAKLVAEHEREACAKDCESMNSVEDYYGERIELFCAEAIRAREQE